MDTLTQKLNRANGILNALFDSHMRYAHEILGQRQILE